MLSMSKATGLESKPGQIRKEHSMKKVLLTLSLLSASLTAQVTTSANTSTPESRPGVVQNNRPLQPNEHPLNLPGVTTIDAPPEGFDPINASDEELAYHGFPPRPDPNAESVKFERWKKMVTTPGKRIVPILRQTNVFHGTAQRVKAPNVESDLSGFTSKALVSAIAKNWSGYVVPSGNTTVNTVVTQLTVPRALQPPGTCTGGWLSGSAWDGIDGWSSQDVLQAGVEFDAFCQGNNVSGNYYAWYEWYPAAAILITNFPVGPGDDLLIIVVPNSPTQATVQMVNNNTLQFTQPIKFTAPAGVSLVGDSAEWAVERPLIGGAGGPLTSLDEFASVVFWNAAAGTKAGTQLDMGSSSALPISMGDANGARIAFPEMLGDESFVVHNESYVPQ
jgi:peptidase A4-like protein